MDTGVNVVAIENQLEETDHSHLGQLLTYATGCGAHIAIWVAPEFGYEHAEALHRLNEWTSERIRFYGVKIEVIKEGWRRVPRAEIPQGGVPRRLEQGHYTAFSGRCPSASGGTTTSSSR